MKSKKCAKCKEIKSIDNFCKDPKMNCGYRSYCKRCHNVHYNYNISKKKLNIYRHRYVHIKKKVAVVKYSEFMKNHPEYKEKWIKYAKNYSLRYPQKRKCHTIVNNMITLGKFKRLPCIICGKVKSEAHHEDYSKPLEVIWYCRQHHKDYHNKKLVK